MHSDSSGLVETVLLWSGMLGYAAAAGVAASAMRSGRPRTGWELGLLLGGALGFALAVADRWARLGHGPFLTLYEVILSNLVTLGFVYAFVHWRFASARRAAPGVLSVLVLLSVWALVLPATASRLPPTYHNPWLWAHLATGKLFLATCLVAVGLAGALLLRRSPLVRPQWMSGSSERELDGLAWRFLALAFVFHSLMLITGAIWAQDAWGRYWSWDPLETWAFTTWLAMALTLHARVTFDLAPWLGWCLILVVFVLAFLTFFGVPFVSQTPHKGAV